MGLAVKETSPECLAASQHLRCRKSENLAGTTSGLGAYFGNVSNFAPFLHGLSGHDFRTLFAESLHFLRRQVFHYVESSLAVETVSSSH